MHARGGWGKERGGGHAPIPLSCLVTCFEFSHIFARKHLLRMTALRSDRKFRELCHNISTRPAQKNTNLTKYNLKSRQNCQKYKCTYSEALWWRISWFWRHPVAGRSRWWWDFRASLEPNSSPSSRSSWCDPTSQIWRQKSKLSAEKKLGKNAAMCWFHRIVAWFLSLFSVFSVRFSFVLRVTSLNSWLLQIFSN